ncbi:Nephrocystin-3 [Trichoplax sp. H2]|nr:Nephrocystin-3 [Trichoplax sp. H2]|eukprot:RDD40857.1 Nephrocystin-3 [Trichoplax sp. H2]
MFAYRNQTSRPINQKHVTSLCKMGQKHKQEYRHQEALSCFKQVLDELKSTPNNENDIDRIRYDVNLNICDIYVRQREWVKANEFSQMGLQLANTSQKKVNKARCLDRQGNIKRLQADLNGALDDYKKSLEIKLKWLESNSLHIAHSYNQIGIVYESQGKFVAALSAYEKSLKIYSSSLGDNHFDTATLYNNIGSIYKKQGKYNKALSIYDKSLKIRISAVGENHPHVATTYNNLASVYKNQGKLDEALLLYDKSLNIQLSMLGDHHPDIATIYNNIGSVYCCQGNYGKALCMYDNSLRIRSMVLGNCHSDVAQSYNNIGVVYCNQNKFGEALSMLDQALKIRLSIFGDNHPEVATSYNNVGLIYHKQGRYDEAVCMFERSLNINLPLFGDNHASVSGTFSNIELARRDQQSAYENIKKSNRKGTKVFKKFFRKNEANINISPRPNAISDEGLDDTSQENQDIDSIRTNRESDRNSTAVSDVIAYDNDDMNGNEIESSQCKKMPSLPVSDKLTIYHSDPSFTFGLQFANVNQFF